MDVLERIENALERSLLPTRSLQSPPLLGAAVYHAVFPGGARVRPRLTLAVAEACGEDQPHLTNSALVAIELLHCASLVHDDLPCFDDAPTRRGRPSVHAAFGEPIAVLAGDALIVRAFEVLGEAWIDSGTAKRVADVLRIVARSVGMPGGIVAGQAWELEPTTGLVDYQRAKTGSLFAAATEAGAAAAGCDSEEWWRLGECLGEAYQVADDIRDVAGTPEQIGKPTGRDAALNRPNAVAQLGMTAARARLSQLVAHAIGSVPNCPGADGLRSEIIAQSRRFLPWELAADVA